MAALGRDRAKRRYSLDMINFKCTIVEQLSRKMNGSHLYIDYIYVPMEERTITGKKCRRWLRILLSPRSHFVANGKLHCFLLDVTNIRVKWRKLERQEIRQD